MSGDKEGTNQALIYQVKRYIQLGGMVEEHVPVDDKGVPLKMGVNKYFVFVTVNVQMPNGMQGPTINESALIKGAMTIGQAYKKANNTAKEKSDEIKIKLEAQYKEMQEPKIITPGPPMPPIRPRGQGDNGPLSQ